MKIKKIASLLLSTLILVSLSSCGDGKGNEPVTSENSGPVEPVEPVEPGDGSAVPTSTVPEKQELIFEYDDTEDVSEPLPHFTELNGDYLKVSKVVEESALTQWPVGMYDVDGGVILVYAVDEFDNCSVMIQNVSTETGKQTYKLSNELAGTFGYIRDVRGQEKYGDADLLIATSSGAYLYDLEKIQEKPQAVEIGLELQYSVGMLTVTNQNAQEFKLENQKFDIYVPENKLAYCVNDGVYVSEIDGTGEQKIVEQPEPQAWFDSTDLVDVKGAVNAVYSNPRFMADGTKLVCDIISYDIISEKVGFVVIDIATKQVTVVNMFDANGAVYKKTNWEDMYDLKYLDLVYIDETTMDIYQTGGSTALGGLARFDCIYDLTTNTITDTKTNVTGITSDFKNMVYNETHKGETGKIEFASFVDQWKYEKGVKLSGATTAAVAISSDYTLVIVTNGSRTESFRVLVNVVKQ